jgi:hypothetical protein
MESRQSGRPGLQIGQGLPLTFASIDVDAALRGLTHSMHMAWCGVLIGDEGRDDLAEQPPRPTR